jgi:hypothetical protein
VQVFKCDTVISQKCGSPGLGAVCDQSAECAMCECCMLNVKCAVCQCCMLNLKLTQKLLHNVW